MLTCKQKKAFEGYEAGQTEEEIKQHFREKQKPAPPLFHDISACLARVWRC